MKLTLTTRSHPVQFFRTSFDPTSTTALIETYSAQPEETHEQDPDRIRNRARLACSLKSPIPGCLGGNRHRRWLQLPSWPLLRSPRRLASSPSPSRLLHQGREEMAPRPSGGH